MKVKDLRASLNVFDRDALCCATSKRFDTVYGVEAIFYGGIPKDDPSTILEYEKIGDMSQVTPVLTIMVDSPLYVDSLKDKSTLSDYWSVGEVLDFLTFINDDLEVRILELEVGELANQFDEYLYCVKDVVAAWCLPYVGENIATEHHWLTPDIDMDVVEKYVEDNHNAITSEDVLEDHIVDCALIQSA